MGTSRVLDEDYVTRHFLEAIESHIADQEAQGDKQDKSSVPSGSAFVHHAYKAEKEKLEANLKEPGYKAKQPEGIVNTSLHWKREPASTSRQRKDSHHEDVSAQPTPQVAGRDKTQQPTPPPPPPTLPAVFTAEYASQASQPDIMADVTAGRHQAQSAPEHDMVADVSRMFLASDSQPGAEGVPASAASAGAKAKAAELGQEGLAELLMAWYYAGYCTGRDEAMRTKPS